MLLSEDDVWSSPDCSTPFTSPVPNTSNLDDLGQTTTMTVTNSNPDTMDIVPVPCPTSSSIAEPTPGASGNAQSQSAVQFTVPLPHLSAYVQDCLQNGKILACFSNLICECAHFYSNQFPISSSMQYQEVGKQLYQRYPCIKFPKGAEPWTVFCAKLSQKNSEHEVQKPEKERSTWRTDFAQTRPTQLQWHLAQEPQQPKATRAHIKAETDKLSPNSTHIQVLLRESFVNRRQWITKLPTQAWAPLITEFPCFEDMDHVIYEYRLIKKTTDLEEEKMQLTKLFRLVAKSAKKGDLQGTNAEKELWLVRTLEKLTAYDKGKGKKTESIITVKKDVSEDKILNGCKTTALSAPRLIIFFTPENTLMEAVIVGDEKAIFCRTDSLLEAVLYLAMIYYITDLDYPRIYSQIMGIVKKYVIREQFDGPTSSKFTNFVVSADSDWKKL